MEVQMMNIPLIVNKFVELIKHDDIVAVGAGKNDKEIISELVKYLSLDDKRVVFVPTVNAQAKLFHDLGQKTISLSDREIDVAIEFVDQVDKYYNFIKKTTNSFIRDKMIAQSALNLVVVTDKANIVDDISSDIYVEISTFAWQRTILNLQSYGVARIVMDLEGNYIKTEIGHYLARVTLDRNITLDDFEYSVRNIPGVLETGVFLGLADTIFAVKDMHSIEVMTRDNDKHRL